MSNYSSSTAGGLKWTRLKQINYTNGKTLSHYMFYIFSTFKHAFLHKNPFYNIFVILCSSNKAKKEFSNEA